MACGKTIRRIGQPAAVGVAFLGLQPRTETYMRDFYLSKPNSDPEIEPRFLSKFSSRSFFKSFSVLDAPSWRDPGGTPIARIFSPAP